MTKKSHMLDQADRYLNSNSAKYAFKHNQFNEVRDNIGFIRQR